MKKTFLLVVIPFLLASCNENHPETFLGIKLGYPPDEEFEKAANENPMLLKRNNQNERWQLTFSKELNIKGVITYNTFKDEEEKELLSSIYITFYKENGYINNNDLIYIKNLYFEKYGNIDESQKSQDYINDNQGTNYQEFNLDNEVKKSYQWNIGNLQVILNVSNTDIEADYFYKKNILEEQGKSEIEEKVKDNF
jgi:hypothetical protein